MSAPPMPPTTRRTWLALAIILVACAATIGTSMLRTSATFDEVVFVAGGVRGFEFGDWDVVPDHPPLMQYIYGLPVRLSGVNLPNEDDVTSRLRDQPAFRYIYARGLYGLAGNDPERIALFSRIPALLFALGLVLTTFLYVRRYWGGEAAVIAAALVAFLPDVLAHGGVAYSDVPATLAILGGIWATDTALRTGSYRRALLAGAVAGIAVSIKINAGILLPIAVVLLAFEALARRGTVDPARRVDLAWLKRLALMFVLASLAAWVILVLVYRGDVTLAQFRWGLGYRAWHMSSGHGVPGYLLGDQSLHGWWYFFPVAFLFKTSAGLHVLLLVALATLAARLRAAPARIFASPLRGPLVGTLLFGAALLSSNLNIGFRYAMPVLPLLCIATAVGCTYAWRAGPRLVRGVIAAALLWAVIFPLTYYPHFLGFISEYGPSRDRNHEVLVDSSLDWGQGLLELRDYMRDNDIPSVFLSYFGSLLPAGYGIRHIPLEGYFVLPQQPPPERMPEWYAISATNLRGVYLGNDPFAQFREVPPDAVLGGSIWLFHVPPAEAP
ncbi:MAG TPA: glycosyltransferase family 39 protein [Longimicrobiales bacterium]|nr:glycosyltransferase family 39 protein [Longimicrobiales bacterium]